MDYFTDVYLKNINKFGDNIQSRVHGQMEHDFEHKLKKSVNKVDLFNGDKTSQKIGEGILATKTMDQDNIVNYLMTRINDNYDNGTVIYTAAPATEKRLLWMIFFKELYQTIGYNRYQIILLDRYITWISDGKIYTSPAHFVGEMDEAIKKQFKIIYNAAALQPIREVQLIIPYHEKMKRGIKITISDTTWKVRGYDKDSVSGVMYVTLEEDYSQFTNLADEEQLTKWSISSNQGDELAIAAGEPTKISFYASFNGAIMDEKFSVVSLIGASRISTENEKDFDITCEGNDILRVCLKDCEAISNDFNVVVTVQNPDWIAIVGPDKIKVGQVLVYELNSTLTEGTISVVSENNKFTIDKIEDNKIYIEGTQIGKDNIVIIYNGVSYPTPIEVIGPWM